jgi:hypothetical protein
MKRILIVVVVIIVAILVIGALKDQIIKSVVTVAATQITGAPVHIDGFSLGIMSQSVRISGFKMYNPSGFSHGILLDLPTAYVKLDLGALLKQKLHLVSAEIELKEMGLEKNKEGKLNVDELKVVKQEPKKEAKPAKQMPMQIDVLKLGMGRIVVKDYTSGAEPTVKVFDINLHKNYKDITSAQQLAALILAEPMKSAGIQGAKIYGVAMLAGVAVLPVAVVATFAGKDSASQEFASSIDKVYEASLQAIKQKGSISKENKATGVISATVDSAQITVKIRKGKDNKTEVVASARKYLLPKPEIAGGILYDISEKLK